MIAIQQRGVLRRSVLQIIYVFVTAILPAQLDFAQTVGGSSVEAALSHVDRTKLAEADKLIEEAIAQNKCPGAVILVGRGDSILYEKAYGNRALKPQPTPMTTDTIFDLASLSKPVGTATSIMMLIERGKLRPQDTVAMYIPAFAANGKEKITIEDLLLHISGLMPDNDIADYANGPKAAWEKIFALKLNWPPQSHFAYSDVNFIVLGELVHIVDGRTLDFFAKEEIFRPLGMTDTTYNPSEALRARCAPTEMRDGKWIVGEVHDPRSYALGGVAGHAGVFSTAEDLSHFCRMILGGGKLNGTRILKASTVAQWITPHPVPSQALDQEGKPTPGPALRTYGFDVDTLYAGIRGERFDRFTTFGHTGFTGTAFWIDPINSCYFILLTNSVHPDGKGNVLRLRHQVATAVAEALLGPAPTTQPSVPIAPIAQANGPVLCGIDVLEHDGFKQLAGRKVGLITNHSGRDRDGNRTVDLLAHAPGVQLVRLFSPEHGIDGVLDAKVDNGIDAKTGLKVFSLYGPTQKPTPQMLEGIDTLVYDIQDVGARFYTYITTLGLCMQAAADAKIKFIVLDRPNPNTGLVVDGPIADKTHQGFTAFGPLPLVHGMTVGELARLYNTEFGVHADLEVIPMQNWRRRMWFDETGLPWINTSPNLRNPNASLLYPAICLLEATNVSVGRGTDQPFEIFGAPWIDGRKLAEALNAAKLPGLRFVPITFEPAESKLAKQKCNGVFAIITDRNAFEPARSGIEVVWQLKRLFGDAFQFAQVGRLLQNDAALTAIGAAKEPGDVPAAWDADLRKFEAAREKCLIYP
ncbi:MAG TPA: exo-beta-N-acetylmuramidase NamZ domain-containing protein [Humisphaera sp.]|jgi:uncharacterized protein YbbC (DUF1343 family)|nr:exo-beta-N-acetylmuramidase NamZ domain-containing protein [Humisphaera sp.]